MLIKLYKRDELIFKDSMGYISKELLDLEFFKTFLIKFCNYILNYLILLKIYKCKKCFVMNKCDHKIDCCLLRNTICYHGNVCIKNFNNYSEHQHYYIYLFLQYNSVMTDI
jgi:hypothetical protein